MNADDEYFAEKVARRDRLGMALPGLLLAVVGCVVAYKFRLLAPFHPGNGALFWTSTVWFGLSAAETFNKRMGQCVMRGEQPPYMEYPGLHVPMLIGRYALLAYLLYLDWRWAGTLYVLTLCLAISPILETIGKGVMFLWLKKAISA